MNYKEDVIKLSPYTFSWKPVRPLPVGYWESNDFDLHNYDGYFYFCMIPTLYESDFGELYLHVKRRRRCEILKNLNLHLVFRYDFEMEQVISNKNVQATEYESSTEITYFLGNLKIRNLSEIICTFSKMQKPSNTVKAAEADNAVAAAAAAAETIEGDIFYDKGKQENRNTIKKNSDKERYEEEKVNEIENKEERSRVSGENALSEDLKSLFLDEEESDIILKVGGQKYPAHKMIIRARSPVFYAMLKHDMKEKKEGAVDIEDCDPHIFREFLYYLYSGKLEKLTDDNVFELHHISDKYDVKLLRMECVDFIRNHLNVGTICDAISLASKHCENDLLTYATKFFIDNVHDILTTVKWQKFAKENPVEAAELFIKTVNQKIPKKET